MPLLLCFLLCASCRHREFRRTVHCACACQAAWSVVHRSQHHTHPHPAGGWWWLPALLLTPARVASCAFAHASLRPRSPTPHSVRAMRLRCPDHGRCARTPAARLTSAVTGCAGRSPAASRPSSESSAGLATSCPDQRPAPCGGHPPSLNLQARRRPSAASPLCAAADAVAAGAVCRRHHR